MTTRILTGKVKPCPMCGSESILLDIPESSPIYELKIHCGDCGLNGYKSFLRSATTFEKSCDKVIEYWNNRA